MWKYKVSSGIWAELPCLDKSWLFSIYKIHIDVTNEQNERQTLIGITCRCCFLWVGSFTTDSTCSARLPQWLHRAFPNWCSYGNFGIFLESKVWIVFSLEYESEKLLMVQIDDQLGTFPTTIEKPNCLIWRAKGEKYSPEVSLYRLSEGTDYNRSEGESTVLIIFNEFCTSFQK